MAPLDILVLTAYPPALGLHGGGLRMFYNVKFLASRHRVTLISFIEHERERELLQKLEPLGVEVRAVPRRPAPVRHLWIPRPAEHYEFAGAAMAAEVRRALRSRRFDVMQAEYLQMAQHVPRDGARRTVLTLHEVQFANAARAFEKAGNPWTRVRRWYDWMGPLTYEVRTCARFDAVVCMTGEDARLLAEFVPSSRLRTIPIGVDSRFFRAGPADGAPGPGKTLLFVGNYRHPPNRESVYTMVERVLPAVLRWVPEAEFRVVGGNIEMLDRERLARHPNVRLQGYVDDLRSCYRECAVFAAPILSGNGMRVKLLEALSMGMAVVTTPLGAQGFSVRPGEELMIAGSPETFAAAAAELLQDGRRRAELGSRARELIRERYDWSVVGRQLLDVVEAGHA
ncbi:MAG: glycosyltransferase [Acidobacteria bacterium]|nr:glycosyltransferase [Acidobacteriota bacterium]